MNTVMFTDEHNELNQDYQHILEHVLHNN